MSSIKRTARQAGLLYTLMAAMNILGFQHAFGRFVVAGDPAATVRRISEHELAYRLAIVNDLAAHVLFIFLVVTLYELFREINRKQALLMVLLVVVPVAGQLANLADRFTPLSLPDADLLPAFTEAQRDAVSHAILAIHGNAALVATPFWGLWLFPFGMLVMKSGYFPRILGILQMAAGAAYVVVGFVSIVTPAQLEGVLRVMMPLYFGEVPMILWLLVRGAAAPAIPVSRPSAS